MTLRLAGISGSLRRGSFNTAVLRAVAELVPDGVAVDLIAYDDVPLYNADLGEPPAVLAFKARLAGADALLVCTPEYNHSVPGVLKNALDWASRPVGKGPLAGLPTGVLSASPGAIGGARAQQHLKNVLLAASAPVFPGAEVVIGGVDRKVVDGALTDEATRTFLTSWLTGFCAWAERQRPS